jgi:hypothetical protein
VNLACSYIGQRSWSTLLLKWDERIRTPLLIPQTATVSKVETMDDPCTWKGNFVCVNCFRESRHSSRMGGAAGWVERWSGLDQYTNALTMPPPHALGQQYSHGLSCHFCKFWIYTPVCSHLNDSYTSRQFRQSQLSATHYEVLTPVPKLV